MNFDALPGNLSQSGRDPTDTNSSIMSDPFLFGRTKNGLNDPRFMTEGTPYVSEAYPFQVCIGWLINNRYLELCKGGDLLACTRRLNGGTNGLADRQDWYDKARCVIKAEDLA